MMGFFFAVSCIIGIVLCCFGGSGSTALDCLLAGADSAVELSISLAGAYLLWMGLINVASEAGLIEKLAARMHKPLRLLMPDAGDASASVTLNLAANFFGLGNAATPFGLDAMKRLNAVNPDKQSASNAICMFLALNASSLQRTSSPLSKNISSPNSSAKRRTISAHFPKWSNPSMLTANVCTPQFATA